MRSSSYAEMNLTFAEPHKPTQSSVFEEGPSVHCLRLLRPQYSVVSTCGPCFSYRSETEFSDFLRLLLRVGRLTFSMRPCKYWVGRLRTKAV